MPTEKIINAHEVIILQDKEPFPKEKVTLAIQSEERFEVIYVDKKGNECVIFDDLQDDMFFLKDLNAIVKHYDEQLKKAVCKQIYAIKVYTCESLD